MMFYTALFYRRAKRIFNKGKKIQKKEKFCKGLYEIAHLVLGAPGAKITGRGSKKKGHHQGAPYIFVSL